VAAYLRKWNRDDSGCANRWSPVRAFNPHTATTVSEIADALPPDGRSENEIRVMTCANPARLLELE
jgi:hypothetical protein